MQYFYCGPRYLNQLLAKGIECWNSEVINPFLWALSRAVCVTFCSQYFEIPAVESQLRKCFHVIFGNPDRDTWMNYYNACAVRELQNLKPKILDAKPRSPRYISPHDIVQLQCKNCFRSKSDLRTHYTRLTCIFVTTETSSSLQILLF